MSVVQAGYFFALVLGVPLANQVAQWQSWRASFALFGLIGAAGLGLIAWFLPEDRQSMAEINLSQRMGRRFDNIRIAFEGRSRVASIIAAFFVSGGFVGFFSYLGTWLSKDLNLSTTAVNSFFATVGVALLAGAFVAGPVSDRFGKRGLSILATLVLAPALVLIPRMPWGGWLFVIFFLSALAFAFRQGPLQALATELVPSRARGALVAMRNTSSQIGIATATLASSQLYDKFGFGTVGLLGGILTLAAAVCILLMQEPVTDPSPQGA
jgi:predicted MFS family arabinose efflux permease